MKKHMMPFLFLILFFSQCTHTEIDTTVDTNTPAEAKNPSSSTPTAPKKEETAAKKEETVDINDPRVTEVLKPDVSSATAQKKYGTENPDIALGSLTDKDTDDEDMPAKDAFEPVWTGLTKEDFIEEKDNGFNKLVFDKEPGPDLGPAGETLKNLDTESNGDYSKAEKELQICSQQIPLNAVWKNFAPFFNYKKNKKFKEFSALFLAIWKRESLYTLPTKGVHVQPNCKNKSAIIVRPVSGVKLKYDLKVSERKDKSLKKYFGKKCNLKKADFGPLQWNYHWRLTQIEFRKDMEKALLLSTKYRAKDVKKLSNKNLGNLIKYNSKALFLLAGLSLKKTAHAPRTTIRNYNKKKTYHIAVNKERKNNLEYIRNCWKTPSP